MININNPETKQFITTDPSELVRFIQEYQSKIMFLVYTGEIKIKDVKFSNIGFGG